MVTPGSMWTGVAMRSRYGGCAAGSSRRCRRVTGHWPGTCRSSRCGAGAIRYLSVRQVTQRNTGRRTAGIDGLVALTSQARAEMAVQVHASTGSHQPSPVRRVYIPKASDKTKMRPLGIPVLADRCHQARVRNALEPEWEARFEPRSYGFRPGRGCHDAIESLFNTLHGKSSRVWILDVQVGGAFDKISHGHLLEMLGGFPAREMIAGWLKAGSQSGPLLICGVSVLASAL